MLQRLFMFATVLSGWFFDPAFGQTAQYLNLRYQEDFSWLKADTVPTAYKRFKYSPLGAKRSAYLSQGGEIRYQSQYFRNEDWGDVPDKSYTAFYTRFLYHTDWHVGKRLRAFAQLNSTFANGRATPNRGIDENRFDVHQAFVDLALLANSQRQLTARIGRQELLYGAQRLISVREGPNNRLRFQGGKVAYQDTTTRVEFFFVRPLNDFAQVLDDIPDFQKRLLGFYLTQYRVPLVGNLDVYYFHLVDRQARFNTEEGNEMRHSIGFRLFNQADRGWVYDTEWVYQFGRFNGEAIRAYTASANVQYSWAKHRAGFKTELISGDKAMLDGRHNTFNPLFPRGAYFGLAALIGPANLMDFHPYLDLEIWPNINFGADYDFFWRYSTRDGIYGPNVAVIYSDGGSQEKHIGNQLGFNLAVEPSAQLSIAAEFTWFDAGGYLEAVSEGENILFWAITGQFKF